MVFGNSKHSSSERICRVCLEVRDDLYNLYETQRLFRRDVTFLELINEFVSIDFNVPMPLVICRQCANRAIQFYMFKVKCETNNLLYTDYEDGKAPFIRRKISKQISEKHSFLEDPEAGSSYARTANNIRAPFREVNSHHENYKRHQNDSFTMCHRDDLLHDNAKWNDNFPMQHEKHVYTAGIDVGIPYKSARNCTTENKMFTEPYPLQQRKSLPNNSTNLKLNEGVDTEICKSHVEYDLKETYSKATCRSCGKKIIQESMERLGQTLPTKRDAFTYDFGVVSKDDMHCGNCYSSFYKTFTDSNERMEKAQPKLFRNRATITAKYHVLPKK